MMRIISILGKLFSSKNTDSFEKVEPGVSDEKTIADNDFIQHQRHFDIDNYYQAEGIALNDYDGDGIPDAL